eukprot:505894_1
MASLIALGGYCDSSSSDEDEDGNRESDDESQRGKEELRTLKDINEEAVTSSSNPKDNVNLPSAELLLESTETPSWLQHQQPSAIEPIDVETKVLQDISEVNNSRKRQAEDNNPADPSFSGCSSYSRTKEPSSPSPVMPPPPALTNAEKRARGRELAKLKNENEKGKEKPPPKSAKERTKQQRIKGQSGIGESFRTWRSDEEMMLRNQDIG